MLTDHGRHAEDPTPRLFNQEFARAEGRAERYLRRGIVTGPITWPTTDTGAAVVPVLASVSRSQCGYIRMAEQAQAGRPLPPHGAEPAPRAMSPVTCKGMGQWLPLAIINQPRKRRIRVERMFKDVLGQLYGPF